MAGNGAYSISYSVTKSGKYTVAIKVDNVHIEGSPFIVTVTPGKAVVERLLPLGQAITQGIYTTSAFAF